MLASIARNVSASYTPLSEFARDFSMRNISRFSPSLEDVDKEEIENRIQTKNKSINPFHYYDELITSYFENLKSQLVKIDKAGSGLIAEGPFENIGTVKELNIEDEIRTFISTVEFTKYYGFYQQSYPEETLLETYVVGKYSEVREVSKIYRRKYLEEIQFEIFTTNEQADRELLRLLLGIELNLRKIFSYLNLSFHYTPMRLALKDRIEAGAILIYDREKCLSDRNI